jgi:uncharacterized membrane protein YdfJ with MMPL/SSD domain
MFKDKRVVIAGAVVLMLLVLGGFFLFSKKSTTGETANAIPTQIPIPTISAESIGLTLKPGVGGKTVIVTISKPEGITAAEYELSYTSKGDIPRGAIGQLDVTKKPVTKEITLGTCSDTCHYDTDVKDIKIILKITKSDGKVYQAEQKLSSLE